MLVVVFQFTDILRMKTKERRHSPSTCQSVETFRPEMLRSMAAGAARSRCAPGDVAMDFGFQPQQKRAFNLQPARCWIQPAQKARSTSNKARRARVWATCNKAREFQLAQKARLASRGPIAVR